MSVTETIKQAFYNAVPLSLEAPFYPFGSEPLRFDTFSIAAPQALSKKGATVVLSIHLEDQIDNTNNPRLSWEYFNGEGWKTLELINDENVSPNLTQETSFTFNFLVPQDLTPTEIYGHEDYWLQVRLISGDYGRSEYELDTSVADIQSITVKTDSIDAPQITEINAHFTDVPAAIPQTILTENNRTVTDQTSANQSDSAQFALFQDASAIDPDLPKTGQSGILYLGLSHSYQANPLSLLIDAQEIINSDDRVEPVELLFEILGPNERWYKISADDQTNGFQHHGLVHLFIDISPQRARLFGQSLFWLRIRPKNNLSASHWKARLKGIYINAVAARHAKTFRQEILGASSGEPYQSFFLSHTPVVSGSLELRVRETLSEDEENDLREIELDTASKLTTEPEQDSVKVIETYPEIPGEWVLWRRVDSLVEHDGDARVYQLDPATGEIRFGEDQFGKIPPAGADAIRAITYQSGGGEAGNVSAYTIQGLKSSVESVDSVTNPIPASGGVDALSVDRLISTAPERLRHNQQALTTTDFEALAIDWSSDIVSAYCQVPEQPGDPIRIYIAKRSGDERCPLVNVVERNALADYLRHKAWGGLSDQSIQVMNPTYIQLTVEVDILAVSAQMSAGVDKAVRDRLLELLHPIDGGVDGKGWPFGRKIWKSDIYRTLTDIPGLDRVDSVSFTPESLDDMPANALICAEEQTINVTTRAASDVVMA